MQTSALSWHPDSITDIWGRKPKNPSSEGLEVAGSAGSSSAVEEEAVRNAMALTCGRNAGTEGAAFTEKHK